MNIAVFRAVQVHSKAIFHWADVEMLPHPNIPKMAGRVALAREWSADAIRHDKLIEGWEPGDYDDIEAACRDAEVRGAIYAHLRAIERLMDALKTAEG